MRIGFIALGHTGRAMADVPAVEAEATWQVEP